jgi:Dolichyl-phosphate-mannose-protein mannosyltransferase
MKKTTLVLVGFLLIKMILQFQLINPVFDLHRDEYLHLDQAKHFAWGFQSVPPLSSWIAWIILQLGNGVFWVKFFPALFGALTILMVWKIIETLNGGIFALCMGAIAILMSVLLRINILFQPNSFEIFIWTSAYYFVIRYIQTEHKKWLYYLAVAVALGFLNKYNIVFLLLGLFPALLITEQRKIFTQPHFYFSILLCILLIAPNLYWQWVNDFPVVAHMQELQRTQLVNVTRSHFIKEQFLFFFAAFFVLVTAFVGFFRYQPFKPFRVLLWGFCFSICFFLYFKAKAYYAIGLYPVLLAFGAVYLEQVLSKSWRVYLKPVCLVFPFAIMIPMFTLIFPIQTPEQMRTNEADFKKFGLIRWEDGKNHEIPQDFADMLGWKEMAAKVDSAIININDPKHTLVYCDNYGQVGAVNYYSKIKGVQAISYDADYLNWLSLKDPIKHVIQVKESKDVEREMADQQNNFESVVKFGKIESAFAREKGTTILILKNTRINLNQLIRKDIAEEKSKH